MFGYSAYGVEKGKIMKSAEQMVIETPHIVANLLAECIDPEKANNIYQSYLFEPRM